MHLFSKRAKYANICNYNFLSDSAATKKTPDLAFSAHIPHVPKICIYAKVTTLLIIMRIIRILSSLLNLLTVLHLFKPEILSLDLMCFVHLMHKFTLYYRIHSSDTLCKWYCYGSAFHLTRKTPIFPLHFLQSINYFPTIE